MSKGGYNGGGTVVHPGSGFFSFNGSRKRKINTASGRDEPGPAKPGSICDFGSIRRGRKKVRVVEFPKKTKDALNKEKQHRQASHAVIRIASLTKQALKAVERSNQNILELRKLLKKAEENHILLLKIAEKAGAIEGGVVDKAILLEIERSLATYEPNKLTYKQRKK